MRNICILDYGLGNIQSLINSIKRIGHIPRLFSEIDCYNFEHLIIPGIGSFSKGSELILNKKFNFLKKKIKNFKILGICLGMQLFFNKGYENGVNNGLNFIEGEVKRIKKNKKLILPFVGYQKIKIVQNIKAFKKFHNKKFYFVHSYIAHPKKKNDILALTENYQGINYTAAVIKKNLIGTQFHPEKSGEIGLELLNSFIKDF